MKSRFLNKKSLIILAAIMLLIFLHLLGYLSPAERLVVRSVNSLGSFFHSLSIKVNESFKPLPDKKTLEEELQEMKSKYTQALTDQAKCEEVYRENEELQDYLNFYLEHEYTYVMAEITSKENLLTAGSRESSIFLNKGESDGIEKDMAVINSDGVVVGKIIKVSVDNSQACLSIDEDCKLAASIISESQTLGIVSGNLGLTISMDFIPQNHELKEGDLVISSGLEENIPPGLLIGTVSRINKQNNEIWQQAILEPLYDIDKLRIVSVVKP
ncbi:MAG: rod shape-determining protein MreC [Candidatus Pacebacteria bacterium]|nr:rod shape-determining protein MreC [Candidatus Paceibacterota bacterium]